MAAFSDLVKSDTTKGVLIGVAAAAVTFALLPLFRKAGRPLARAAVKTGIILYEKTRETAAEIGEIMEDLVAEAQAELRESSTSRQEPETSQKPAKEEVEIEIQ